MGHLKLRLEDSRQHIVMLLSQSRHLTLSLLGSGLYHVVSGLLLLSHLSRHLKELVAVLWDGKFGLDMLHDWLKLLELGSRVNPEAFGLFID